MESVEVVLDPGFDLLEGVEAANLPGVGKPETWVAELGGVGACVAHENTFADQIELESGSGHGSFAVDAVTVTHK